MIKKHLPAASARGDETPPSVTSSGDSQKLLCPCSRRNAKGNKFRARATVEVVDIHCLVNVPVYVHCRCCYRVIVIGPEGSCQGFCGINYPALGFKWFHKRPP